MIETIYTQIDGLEYSWVYIPDELWSQAVFITVINGMEID